MGLIPKAELHTSSGVHRVVNIYDGCISEENEVREVSIEGILEVKGWRKR